MNKPTTAPAASGRVSWRRYLPPLIFLGWWDMFTRLFGGGTYQNYLHPKLGWLILLGWVITALFLVGAMAALLARKHAIVPRSTAEALVLIVPFFYVFLGTDTGLRSGALSGRVLWNVFDGLPPPPAAASAEADDIVSAKELNLLQLWNMARSKEAPPQCVSISGMYYRDQKAPVGTFLLFRYALSCCAADAQPVMIPVRVQKYNVFTNDAWVRVEGTVSIFTNTQGIVIPLVGALHTQCIPSPSRKEQYLYPTMSW